MLFFVNDYGEGAHEAILDRLVATNREALPGYGMDTYCESAKAKILDACGCPNGAVYFLVGGTQTNMTVIDAMLAKYEGVVGCKTGRIECSERVLLSLPVTRC